MPRIMIIDDDPDFQEFLSMFLELEGYQVSAAFDGVSALEKIDADSPDLILMDVLMPQMDGFEVALNLLARGKNAPPVIFVSALGDDAQIRRGLALGAVHYITKPLEIVELLDTIKGVVGPPGGSKKQP
jgi:DNA-binding response OmpR family regulator